VRGQIAGGSTYVVVVPDPIRKQAPPPETENREEGPQWVRENASYLLAPAWTRPFVRKS
jgi:hypothetical protein